MAAYAFAVVIIGAGVVGVAYVWYRVWKDR